MCKCSRPTPSVGMTVRVLHMLSKFPDGMSLQFSTSGPGLLTCPFVAAFSLFCVTSCFPHQCFPALPGNHVLKSLPQPLLLEKP